MKFKKNEINDLKYVITKEKPFMRCLFEDNILNIVIIYFTIYFIFF